MNAIYANGCKTCPGIDRSDGPEQTIQASYGVDVPIMGSREAYG